MTTPTISNIRSARDKIRDSLKTFSAKDFEGSKFGPEGEYTAKGLVAGLSALLTDISSLTKAPARFIKYSTHAERNQIFNILNAINTDITTRNIANLATHIDQLKPLIWRYGIRYTDIRQQSHDECIDNLQKKTIELDEKVKDINELVKSSEEQLETFGKLVEKITEQKVEIEEMNENFSENLALSTKNRDEVELLLIKDKERSDQIKELLSDAKSHSALIGNFISRVEKRESQLEKQEALTQQYTESINNFKQERNDLLKKANELISSAKQALEYKTAEGLSAAFNTKYDESKQDNTLKYWLIGSGAFVFIALLVGVWILRGNQTDFKVVLGRISLLPMLIAGSWFCASQYVKQINIREDYAYKSVLSKSIVGFSEQLKNNQDYGEEYSHYIKSVLEELHKDPLRKRIKDPASPSELKQDIKDLIKEIKIVQEISKHIPVSTNKQ